jgi:methanogenic corrinoid protein MtbC1
MSSVTQDYSQRDEGARGGGQVDCLHEAQQLELPAHLNWGQDALEQPETEARLGRLVSALESEVIPRLLQAHRVAPAIVKPEVREVAPTDAEVRAFAQLVLARDDRPATELIDGLRARGASVEGLFLHLLAPAARHLGALWEQDLCDFTEVTIGVGRMQQIMRELSPVFGIEVEHPPHGLRILLAPAPGEQHTFGLSMVAEFFRRAGWEVVGGTSAADSDPVDIVESVWFDVIGISVGNETRLDWLTNGISSVRRASLNQSIGVMVGGPIFREHPEYVALVGADATAVDGRHAPALAESLLDLRSALKT